MSTYGYLEVFHRVRDNQSRLYSDRVNRVHIKLFLNEQFDPDLHSRREYIHLRVVIFFLMFKCYVSAHISHVQIRNKCVTFAYSCTHMSHILHMRTTVRICNAWQR